MTNPGELNERLDEALQQQITAGCPGALLAVESNDFGVSYRGAAGRFARASDRPLRPDDPFRAASVTKAVTASCAAILAGRGIWDLDDPITRYLPGTIRRQLIAFHGTDALEVTIRRLLDHTSSLPDYFFDERFQRRVVAEPDRHWQPEELLAAALESEPLGVPPGTEFSYGDTGYVVVGLAIQHILGCSLAEAYRSLIFEPLDMQATYLEWHEAHRGKELSHHYDDGRDLRDLNTSFDWAGGGLVTTASDLVRFLGGAFEGRLLDERERAELTRWRQALRWRPRSSARYLRYGLGVGQILAYGEELWGATGCWGAFAFHWPRRSTSIAGTLNLVGADRAALLDAVVQALVSVEALDLKIP